MSTQADPSMNGLAPERYSFTTRGEFLAAAMEEFASDNRAHRLLEEKLADGDGRPRTARMKRLGAESRDIKTLTPEEIRDIDTQRQRDAENLFWKARPELEDIHGYARSRRVSPWAVLGCVMARVIADTDPEVVLPALVGGRQHGGSLNLFIAIVGASGVGKGTAESAAADLYPFQQDDDEDAHQVVTAGVGSGEGLAHVFAQRQKGVLVRVGYKALVSIQEIDTLRALVDRKGTTILAELRKGWMGEQLGMQYADPAKRLPVPAGTYRAALIAGVQEDGHASVLLDDASGGTPQRFLWFPAPDPEAPDEVDRDMPCPAITPVTFPARFPGAKHTISVCRRAAEEIDADRLQRLRGGGNTLDGQAMFARLKAAAALALICGDRAIGKEEWELAATVMAISNRTRQHVLDTQAKTRARSNNTRAQDEGERAVVVDQRLHEHHIQRVEGVILRKAERLGGVTKRELRDACASRDREYFPGALEHLIATTRLVLADGKYGLPEEGGHGGDGGHARQRK